MMGDGKKGKGGRDKSAEMKRLNGGD